MAVVTNHREVVHEQRHCDGMFSHSMYSQKTDTALDGGPLTEEQTHKGGHGEHDYIYTHEAWSGPQFPVAKYVGMTFCDRERNYYDDSDGYSHVFDGEEIIEVGTWTTRAGTNHVRTTVDAYENTDTELVERMRQAFIAKLSSLAFMFMKREFESAEYQAKVPAKGMTLKVVKGRKVPVGTVGECIWTGERSYSQWQAKYGAANLRVGIKDADGNVHWTDASNVEVVNPVMPDPEDYFTMDAMLKAFNSMDLKTLHSKYCSTSASLSGLIAAGRF